MAAGALTGFETPLSTLISLALFLIGGAFVVLGLYRRDDWVELKIDRREPPPSFWYIVVFLPFWLMLQSRKRYRVPGNGQQVDAFYHFLTARLPSNQ
jgi:4-hydroxybenzoate polyprenyltransferase